MNIEYEVPPNSPVDFTLLIEDLKELFRDILAEINVYSKDWGKVNERIVEFEEKYRKHFE